MFVLAAMASEVAWLCVEAEEMLAAHCAVPLSAGQPLPSILIGHTGTCHASLLTAPAFIERAQTAATGDDLIEQLEALIMSIDTPQNGVCRLKGGKRVARDEV